MIGPEVRGRPAFTLCGMAGVALAIAVGLALAAAGGADLGVMAAVCVAACAAFLALALAEKVLGGVERLVYYHHQAAVVGVAALVPWAFGRPVLPYLDAAAAGLGVFLACGRVGCLVAGCCHGRPAGRGIRYTAAHAAEGFPAHLVGVPLVPVQVFEAAGVLALAAAAAAVVAADAAPGTALALYLSGYAVLRFGLELLRGDAPRPYLGGLSAAQWTSLAIAVAVAAWRPGPGAVAVAAALAASTVALAATARRRRLLGARHVAELAAALDEPGVRVTSLGVRVSAGREAGVWHCTLSSADGPLPDATAAALATLVGRLRGAAPEMLRGPTGAVHVLIRDGR